MEEESWLNQDSSPGAVEEDIKDESVEESTTEKSKPSNWGMQAAGDEVAAGFVGPEDEQEDGLSDTKDAKDGEEDFGEEKQCQRCVEEGMACSREHLSEASSFPKQRKG